MSLNRNCYLFLVNAVIFQRLDLRGHRVRSLNASGLKLSSNLEVNSSSMYSLFTVGNIYSEKIVSGC